MRSKKNTKVKDLRFEDVPLVSVIVPTYNRAQLLRETVASILSQTFDDFELIIVDNMSEDGTEQYVKGLEDPRIRYFRNANNGIIAVNRNVGIKNAKGKYIAFCDDDDLWLPNKLEEQVELMEKNMDLGLCGGYVAEVGPQGDILSVPQKDSIVFRHFNFDSLVRFNHIVSCTAIVRKSCLENVGVFSEDPNLVAIEDYDLWLRIAWQYKVAQIPFIVAKLRRHSANTNRDKERKCINWLRVLQKYEDMGYVDSKTLKQMRGIINRRLFVRMSLQRNGNARRYALESVKNSFNLRSYMCLCISLLPKSWAFHVLVVLLRASKITANNFQKTWFSDSL